MLFKIINRGLIKFYNLSKTSYVFPLAQRYSPIHLAFKIFESSKGSDENLSPIIFLHGITASKESWNDIPQIIAEKTKRKTYAYDARNHGDSGYSEEFSFDMNVDDLFHFMDTMNIPKAILIGHSMGGLTAGNAALKKPERVEKVFSEDIHLKKVSQEQVNILLHILILRAESIKHVPPHFEEAEATKFSSDFMIDKLPVNSPFLKMKHHIYNAKLNLKRNIDGGFELKHNTRALIRALQNAESLMSEPQGRFNGPTCFIYADKSLVSVGTEKDNLRIYFPNAEFVEFKTESHNIHIDFQDEFVETVLKRLL